MIDEIKVSRLIIKNYADKLTSNLSCDVAIVGGGPAGLAAAYYLAKGGAKVSVYEKKLSFGGGMWGGGIMFNVIVLQKGAAQVCKDLGIRLQRKGNYYIADAVESVGALCVSASRAGATLFNLLSAEDVMIREKRVAGLVLNWTSVEMAGLHPKRQRGPKLLPGRPCLKAGGTQQPCGRAWRGSCVARWIRARPRSRLASSRTAKRVHRAEQGPDTCIRPDHGAPRPATFCTRPSRL